MQQGCMYYVLRLDFWYSATVYTVAVSVLQLTCNGCFSVPIAMYDITHLQLPTQPDLPAHSPPTLPLYINVLKSSSISLAS